MDVHVYMYGLKVKLYCVIQTIPAVIKARYIMHVYFTMQCNIESGMILASESRLNSLCIRTYLWAIIRRKSLHMPKL